MATRVFADGGAQNDRAREPGAPSMTRSRGQLSGSYAPGAIFTFEGGLGSCLSIPDQGDHVDLAPISEETKRQVHLRLREVWQNWFSWAMQAGNDKHPALPAQCLDDLLTREGSFHPPSPTAFELVDPKRMGYIPAPLAFVCNSCGRFRSFDSVAAAKDGLASMASGSCSPKGSKVKGQCRWRQLDVIFVHWSGNWCAPEPGRFEWSVANQKVQPPIASCALCRSETFFLRDKSPRIGEWFFECELGHKDGDSWLQNDEETTQILGDECKTRPPRWRRMEPISYRASAAYYPHSEQFVVFSEEQRDLLALLREDAQGDLGRFIAEHFGLASKAPSIDEVLEILERAGHSEKVAQYRSIKNVHDMMVSTGQPDMADKLRDSLALMMKDWEKVPNLIPVDFEVPALLRAQIARRSEFGSRYDPLVLAVEHEALKRSKLSATVRLDGRAGFVRFTNLDRELAPKGPGEKAQQEEVTSSLMQDLGIAELGLIREFDLCRFTHGYTRMSNEPRIEKSDQQKLVLPVRLRLFPQLRSGKKPIYVVTQANEAIYISLRPEMVYEWLKRVGVADLPEWNPAGRVRLGASLLQSAQPFGKYFSELHEGPADSYRYVYTLLHTFSHALMRGISASSGLDIGSLGEYLFPADLAFVVYRNGTTMDLGNLSSLWRNMNNALLEAAFSEMSLLCGSGSLCETKGGACPHCIVVPETSCIAANRLLSRTVLTGGLAPREDDTHKGMRIPGYFEIAREVRSAGQPAT